MSRISKLKKIIFALSLCQSDRHFKADTIIRGVSHMYGRFNLRRNGQHTSAGNELVQY